MSSEFEISTEKTSLENEKILKLLAASAFLVFVNGYMVAPLIPALSREFSVSIQQVGLIVPAYMIPYGISTLFYGPLSDRVGRSKVLLVLLAGSILTSLLVSFGWSVRSLLMLRVLSGLCAGGIVPIALALVGDLYPYKSLGRAMGWMFGAIAGGVACGATFGAWMNASVGWRKEFAILACANLIIFLLTFKHRKFLGTKPTSTVGTAEVIEGYWRIITSFKGSHTYPFIFLNAIYHSGIFTWLALYLTQRYQLNDIGIGQALLGYGIPGMLLGPFWGRLADRFGRRLIIPSGFLLASICGFLLIPKLPLFCVTIVIVALSIGFDMTHPLMSGIIAAMDPKRRGQAMGVNAFSVFIGFGLGAVLFQCLMAISFNFALTAFAIVQLILAAVSLQVFHFEKPVQAE